MPAWGAAPGRRRNAPRTVGQTHDRANGSATVLTRTADGSGFQPSALWDDQTWGCAPGWDGAAPLALARGDPSGREWLEVGPACGVSRRRPPTRHSRESGNPAGNVLCPRMRGLLGLKSSRVHPRVAVPAHAGTAYSHGHPPAAAGIARRQNGDMSHGLAKGAWIPAFAGMTRGVWCGSRRRWHMRAAIGRPSRVRG